MKDKNPGSTITTDNGRLRRCLLRSLTILVIAVLIAAATCYSQTPSNKTSQRTLSDKPESIEQENHAPQVQLDCAGLRLKGLWSVTAHGTGELGRSIGNLFGLTSSDIRGGSHSWTPCKELPAGFTLSGLSIVPSVWPVIGRVTARFGKRQDPFSGEDAFHYGLDIASHYGDAIRASADGIVANVKRGGSYGLLVVINHGFGVASWYGHLSKFVVQVGTRVRRGEIIGYEGRTGRATGTHLHYEVRIDNAPINPMPFLSGFPQRSN